MKQGKKIPVAPLRAFRDFSLFIIAAMEEKLVTLAILTYSKAQILKNVLENEGIDACIQNVNLIQPVISSGVRVRIKEHDLPRALKIIESSAWLAEDVVSEDKKKEEKSIPKILIPVDFSSYSLKACEFGFNIASHIHAEIILLHVYFSPIYVPNLQYVTEDYSTMTPQLTMRGVGEDIHNRLLKLSKTIDKKIADGEYPHVNYTCILREGIPEEEILHYARKEKPVIIIMGTRGESQKELDLIGSVTAEVIDRSPTFVYAIPENSCAKTFDEIKRVGMITNFDQRDLIAFDSLITTFKDYNFEISFIHLNTDEQKRTWNEIKLAGIKEYFKKQYPNLKLDYHIIDENHLLTNLDNFLTEKQIDVLCVTNYKRNVFARLFNPSIARKMLFHSRIPILVIK